MVPTELTELHEEPPVGRRLSAAPTITVYDGVLSPGECQAIIDVAAPKMRAARVSGVAGVRRSAGRTNDLTWVAHGVTPTIAAVAARIAGLVGLPLAHAEALQVIHYGPGQEYRPHFDAYDLTTEKGRRYCARGGQRLFTALAYLGDVDDGGATAFPHLGIEVEPRRGRVVIFSNCYAGTTTRDPRSYHQGKPPRAGDKWAFNLWFHERAYQGER